MKSFKAGEILEQAIRSRNINISALSRRMNIHRKTLYNWFTQEKLQMEMVFTIGKLINHDFSQEFKDELLDLGVKVSSEENTDQQRADAKENQYYMQKYAALLEDYTAVLRAMKASDAQSTS
jgi:plasmid maintenance system antidote protein VapI